MPVDPATAKIIAAAEGGFVRVCPICGEQIEENSEEVEGIWIQPDGTPGNVNETERLQGLGLKSYDTVIHHDAMAAHLKEVHDG